MFTKVVKAQLWVYLRPLQHTSTVYLQILRLKPVTDEGSKHIRIRSLKIDLHSRTGHWQSIDFKHVLQNWFKQPHNNWGIEINAFDPNGNDLAVTSFGPGAEGLHPFIELRVMENNKRSRRNLGLDCDEHSTESRCCRYPLTVDFEAFGWDWIIAPKRYKANYCSGQCEYMFMQKYPHTHLVQQANPRGSAGPCCTPTKMSPINMLYFNDKQKIILWQDTWNGCRPLWVLLRLWFFFFYLLIFNFFLSFKGTSRPNFGIGDSAVLVLSLLFQTLVKKLEI
ncbi:unnamed protein product [Staurois parvus]|uniref:TGF-beta family profile domain-containing protein n=1 Tax=Staurois parvus TaxID=386267 RepID=A0ABN9F3M9_9NEOB|nr:unnamed protein product [Staurois parvus]